MTQSSKFSEVPYRHELLAAVISLLSSTALIILATYIASTLPHSNPIRIWAQWDALHYLNIAQYGYFPQHLDTAAIEFMSRFPPLYPALLSAFSWIFAKDYILSAIILSIVLTCIASIYLYKLVFFEFKSNSVALWSVLFINILPTKYFLIAPYSESLFLLLILMYFYYMRVQPMNKVATIIYAAALLTRVFGIFMYPVHVYFCIAALRKSTGRIQILQHIFLLVLPGIVLSAYQLFVRYVLNSEGYLFSSDMSSIKLAVPFTELYNSYSKIVTNPHILFDEYFLYTLGFTAIFMLIIIVLTTIGFARLPLFYSIYSVSYIICIASLYWVISGPRFALVCFPSYIVLARIQRTIPKIIISVLLGALLYTFSSRYFIGLWAF